MSLSDIEAEAEKIILNAKKKAEEILREAKKEAEKWRRKEVPKDIAKKEAEKVMREFEEKIRNAEKEFNDKVARITSNYKKLKNEIVEHIVKEVLGVKE